MFSRRKTEVELEFAIEIFTRTLVANEPTIAGALFARETLDAATRAQIVDIREICCDALSRRAHSQWLTSASAPSCAHLQCHPQVSHPANIAGFN